MIVYLDIDGVLADWVGAIEEMFDVELDRSSYNIHGQLGLTRSALFEELDGEFWATLPKTALADEIMLWAATKGTVRLCTAACHESPEAAWGRHEWCNKWYPDVELVAIKSKYLLANGQCVLVDDVANNTDLFTAHGGRGILYPAPHNAMRNVKDPLAYLERQL